MMIPSPLGPTRSYTLLPDTALFRACLRLLPALSGRNCRPRRHAGLLHHAGGRGHVGLDPDPAAEAAASRRHGTLHLRPSARLPPYRSEEHTSELQSLMRISYAVFCLKKTT